MLQAIIDAIRNPLLKTEDGIVFKHKDYVEEHKPLHYKPDIHHNVIQQTILNSEDFMDFVNEYKTHATKIFFDDEFIVAIFNYPEADKADYADSFAKMPLLETKDFTVFQRSLEKRMPQKEFVRYLKRMEPYIIALDGKQADDMDIIEMAENLQAITKIESITRNTANKFTIDAEVKTGKTGVTIPRYITFEFPVYKNDRDLLTKFDVELFLSADGETFMAELVCYNIDLLLEETRRLLVKKVCKGISGVKAFQG